jgi:hypothetical protein
MAQKLPDFGENAVESEYSKGGNQDCDDIRHNSSMGAAALDDRICTGEKFGYRAQRSTEKRNFSFRF